MALTPHSSYSDYKKEHEKANPGVAPVSESQWAKSDAYPAAGAASTAPAAAAVRKPSRVSPSGSMREVGVAEAGQTGTIKFDAASLGLQSGEAVLYDEESGKLYATSRWRDVERNSSAWVDLQGRRFAGYVGTAKGSTDEKPEFQLNRGSRPFQVAAFGEAPEKGTEGYQKWLEKQFAEGMYQQAMSNRYDPESNKNHTDFGAYGSISVEDWVELGRPKSFGGDKVLFEAAGTSFDELDKLSDAELLSRAGGATLMTVDTKLRSHGLSKVLNKVGDWWGDSNFGDEFMRVVTDIGEIPIIGTATGAGMVSNVQNAYEGARRAGKSGSYEAGKALAVSSASGVIDAAAAVLTVLSVVTLFPSGGTSAIVGGAAIGTLYGAAASAAKSGVSTATYGGFDEGKMWNQVGEGAVYGAIQGAFAGASVNPGGGGWQATARGYANNPYVQGGVNTAASYALNYSAGGERREHAAESAMWSAAGTVVGAQFGVSGARKNYEAFANDPATLAALNRPSSGLGSGFSNYVAAFREQYAAQRGSQAWLVSRGTVNQLAAASGGSAEKLYEEAAAGKYDDAVTWNPATSRYELSPELLAGWASKKSGVKEKSK